MEKALELLSRGLSLFPDFELVTMFRRQNIYEKVMSRVVRD
jgi:hypothetical protein